MLENMRGKQRQVLEDRETEIVELSGKLAEVSQESEKYRADADSQRAC